MSWQSWIHHVLCSSVVELLVLNFECAELKALMSTHALLSYRAWITIKEQTVFCVYLQGFSIGNHRNQWCIPAHRGVDFMTEWKNTGNDILYDRCPCTYAWMHTEHIRFLMRIFFFFHWMEGNVFALSLPRLATSWTLSKDYTFRLFSYLNYLRVVFWMELGNVGQTLVGKWEHSTGLYLVATAEVLLSKALDSVAAALSGHHLCCALWKVQKLIFPACDVD